MSSCKAAWVTKSNISDTPWGTEISWYSSANNVVKTLTLSAGNRNSFKYNKNKDEMLICGAGKVKVYFGDEDLISRNLGDLSVDHLTPGCALIVQSGCPYRLEAIDDAIILEVSSNKDSGPVRLHDDYGRDVVPLNKFMQGVVEKWFQS